MSPDHSFVFLTYNRPELIDQRLDEVDRYFSARKDFEVVVLDNGSEDRGVQMALGFRKLNHPWPLTVVRKKKNIGFGPGFNYAAHHAKGTNIYLISDDVTIFGDFTVAPEWGEVVCHRIISKGGGWNDFPERSIAYPDGYFIAMQKGTWDDLGGFDERFAPHDYEDVDLAVRIEEAGMRLIERSALPVRHGVAGTLGYNDERYERTVAMRALFAEKWNLTNRPPRP